MKKVYLSFIVALVGFNSLFSQQAQSEVKNIYLETIGKMSSSGLYLTYLSISVIKQNIDLDDNPDYYKDYENVTASIISTIDMNVEGLSKLKKSGELSETDSKLIDNLNDVFLKLKKDAQLLTVYLNSQKDDDYKIFSDFHDSLFNTMNQFFNSK